MGNRKHTAVPWRVGCAIVGTLFAGVPAAVAQTPVGGEKVVRPTETETRLQSLRRSVENATDIKIILDRYARFIEQYKESPVAKEAERDAATWKDRQAKGMVKVGPRWVTPAERETLKAKARATAIEARDAMVQLRMAEGEALVRQALEEDPANIGATYLNGLLLYGQNQKAAAKKCFEAVAAVVPLEGPTLNNLAVIQWGFSQPSLAMKLYEQAMVASRMNKEILRNAAEAINALPPNQKTTIVAKNAIRVYDTQQEQLAKKLEQEGLYPWGATWVDQATLTRLQGVEKQVQLKVSALSIDYDKVQKQVDDLDKDVEANEKAMRIMESATSYRDAKGVTQTRPLPPRYYEVQSLNNKLAIDRSALLRKQNDLRSQATLAEQEIPIKKFSLAQKLIGPEGMPVPPATAGATTKPATTPAIKPS